MAATGQGAKEKHLPLDGWISEDGREVNLSWRDTQRPHRGVVEVSRRVLGETGANSWRPVEVTRGPGLRATDTGTKAGVAYEYRVLRQRKTGGVLDIGYWATGREIPAEDRRGTVHMVVDETVVDPLGPYLGRFRRDLIGDGWNVITYVGPRHAGAKAPPLANLNAVARIRAQIKQGYDADPFSRHVVVLIGHLPLIRSGKAAPDGHGAEPHATDLIYGDMDGRWRATPEGEVLDNALPSDAIEMQVGRISFAPVAWEDPAREIQLLRAYFDKNHHWRHGRLGDLRQAYGKGPGVIGERYGLRNIVGPGSVVIGGHHDVGETQPWLWGVHFGATAGHHYAEKYANKAVFVINFGSHKQKIHTRDNALTASLAQPWYTLAAGWGARPAWWPHHMALGGSIGDVHMRTVNNGVAAEPHDQSMEYLPTGLFLWRNPVWVNLLGDPTLRAFPLSPPAAVQAVPEGQGVRVSWQPSPDPDVLGYRLYKGQNGASDFVAISGDGPIQALELHDPGGQAGDVYMLRAYGRKEVYAGSFFTYSQGMFAQAGRAPLAAPEIIVEASAGAPVPLPEVFNAPQGQVLHSFVTGAPAGQVRHMDGGWHYLPPTGFEGSMRLRYGVTGPFGTAEGLVTVRVAP